LKNLFNAFNRKGLEIDVIRDDGICHDCSGIGIDEAHLNAFFTKGLSSLASGIVKFTCLADDDRPGSDNEHVADILTSGHLEKSLANIMPFLYTSW